MAARSTAPLPKEAEQLKQQIQDWRRAKANPSVPMPGALWETAIRLAKEFGICRISRAVGLDYGWLRKRVGEASWPAAPVLTRFIELPSVVVSPPAPALQVPMDPVPGITQGIGPVVELSAPDGARMRIRLETGTPLDLAGLVSSFLGRGR